MFHGWIELMAVINQLRSQTMQDATSDVDPLSSPTQGG